MVKENTRKGRLVQERMRKQSCHAKHFSVEVRPTGQLRADAMRHASTFRPPLAALTVFAQDQLRGIFDPVSDHDYNNAKSALVDMLRAVSSSCRIIDLG